MTGSPLTAFRLAARIAGREAWQARVQSVLVILLVLVPVAVTTAILTVAESGVPTREETAAIWLGANAQASLEVVSSPDESLTQDAISPDDWTVARDESGDRLHSDPRADDWLTPAQLLPAGTTIVPISESFAGVVAETATGQGRLVYVEGEVWHPSLDGAFRITSGRAPAGAGEVLVTDSSLARLGAQLGDTMSVREPSEVMLTIVGTVDDATRPDAVNAIYAAPGTLPAAMTQLYAQRFVLPELALTWDEVQELNRSGIVVLSRAVLADPPARSYRQAYDPREASFGLVLAVGLFSGFAIIVLAGAAFTIGARRRQRSLALLSSVGASRGTIFRVVTSDGLVLGTVGAASGVAAGIGAAFIWLSVGDDGNRLAFPGFHLNPAVLVLVAVVAVAVSLLAALAPAIAASRIDALQAMRSADRPPSRARRPHLVGLPLLLTGIAAMVICGALFSTTPLAQGKANPGLETNVLLTFAGGILGLVVALAGAALTIPLLLRALRGALARAALPARLAAHDIASDLRRTAPIAVVILLMVALATVTVATTAHLEQRIRSTAVIEALPGRVAVALAGPSTTEQTPDEAADIATEARDILERTLDVAELRILQRPAQDWTPLFGDGDLAYIHAVPAEDALCPLSDGSAFSGQAQYQAALDDPRCGADATSLRVLFTGYGLTTPSILIGSADDLEFVIDSPLDAEQRTLLDDGGALAFWPQLVTEDGTVTVATESLQNGQLTREDTSTLPAQALDDGKRLWHHIFITPDTATSIGLTPVDGYALATLHTAPTQAQRDAAWAELNALVPGIAQVGLVRDPTAEPQRVALNALVLASAIAVAAGLLAVGLGWIEGRCERRTLWTLGASPATVRLAQGAQTGLLAGAAALLGIVIGLVPAIAFFGATDIGFDPPWAVVLGGLFGLPLLLALVTASLPLENSRERP